MTNRSFNHQVARIFRDYARLLEVQGGNAFRIGAYRRAAEMLESLPRDASDILRLEGVDGLVRLPFIGRRLAGSIAEIATNGRLSKLEQLRGGADPESLFRLVPGVGPGLARKIHNYLHVETLEALEVAAHDGRLRDVPGVGGRRVAAIQSGLATLLAGGRRRLKSSSNGPPIELLLDIDREYRTKSAADKLPRIAPKRFNPGKEAWLPIFHTDRSGWHFTVLFSNTARAHDLGRTQDWVIVHFDDDHDHEGQCTVVTETRGPQKGRRVVRGRESESDAPPPDKA